MNVKSKVRDPHYASTPLIMLLILFFEKVLFLFLFLMLLILDTNIDNFLLDIVSTYNVCS